MLVSLLKDLLCLVVFVPASLILLVFIYLELRKPLKGLFRYISGLNPSTGMEGPPPTRLSTATDAQKKQEVTNGALETQNQDVDISKQPVASLSRESAKEAALEQPLRQPYRSLANKAIAEAQYAVRLNTVDDHSWNELYSAVEQDPKALKSAPDLIVRRRIRGGAGGTVFTSRSLDAPPEFAWAIATDQKFRSEVDSDSKIDAVLEKLGTGLDGKDAIVHITTAAKGPVSQRHMTILVHSRRLEDGVTIATVVKSIRGHKSDPDPSDSGSSRTGGGSRGWVRMDTTSVAFYRPLHLENGSGDDALRAQRCQRVELTQLDLKLSRFIPIDVMGYIFKKLTAKSLHKLAKCVRREWQSSQSARRPAAGAVANESADGHQVAGAVASKSAADTDGHRHHPEASASETSADDDDDSAVMHARRPTNCAIISEDNAARTPETLELMRRRSGDRSWVGTMLEDAQPYLVAAIAVMTAIRFVRGR